MKRPQQKSRRSFLQSSAGLLAASPFIALGRVVRDNSSKKLASEINALFEEYDRPSVPGASVMVINRGKVLFKKAYGLANVEEDIRATTRTNYRLASVTKQFTAMAILMLAERKKLSLDDPLTRFFPVFPEHGKKIAVRHMLNHTSGLIAYEGLIPKGTTTPLKDKDVLALLSQQNGTYFPAGSKFRYSNSGYAILASIVEAVSQISFAQFLKRNIFDRLGMSATVAYEQGISTVRHRAYGYSRGGDRFERTDQSLTSSVLGDGGIYSSVEDLFKWDHALYTSKLVSARMLKQAFTAEVSTDKPNEGYGFGWYIRTHKGLREISHSGETIGFRNFIGRFPDRRFTVIVLINRAGDNPTEIARKIADMILFTSDSRSI